MSWIEHLYALSLGAARPLLSVGRVAGGRIARSLDGRREAVRQLEAWAARSRDPARPLVWFHAPSVGEALMAQAIIRELRALADIQVTFTFFSTSAERMAERVGADVHAYLPWDVPRETTRALAALRPAAIVFVRTEVWPTLARLAQARGAKLLLVNAPLAATSSRTRPLARFALRPTYARLDAVGAVSADDAPRFTALGVPAVRVRVTGDARFDQVWSRAQTSPAPAAAALLERLAADARPVMVAGSTWPADEAHLVEAWSPLRAERRLRLIIAPHEPSEPHLKDLMARLSAAGISGVPLRAFEEASGEVPDVLVIDRVGLLADLYRGAAVAYVGGGFGRSGLHSVIEPAALGVPVVFGPRHGNAREAGELAAAGGGAVIADASALADAVRTFLDRPEGGRAARAFVESRLGGAARNAALIAEITGLGAAAGAPLARARAE